MFISASWCYCYANFLQICWSLKLLVDTNTGEECLVLTNFILYVIDLNKLECELCYCCPFPWCYNFLYVYNNFIYKKNKMESRLRLWVLTFLILKHFPYSNDLWFSLQVSRITLINRQTSKTETESLCITLCKDKMIRYSDIDL